LPWIVLASMSGRSSIGADPDANIAVSPARFTRIAVKPRVRLPFTTWSRRLSAKAACASPDTKNMKGIRQAAPTCHCRWTNSPKAPSPIMIRCE
jgi:hypothetical protein